MSPCNIAVDPRVYRGSVSAARRQIIQPLVLHEKSTKRATDENRNRIEVSRWRLNSSLPPLSTSIADEKLQKCRKNGYRIHYGQNGNPFPPIAQTNGNIDKAYKTVHFTPLRTGKQPKTYYKREVTPILARQPLPPCSCPPSTASHIPRLSIRLRQKQHQRQTRVISRNGFVGAASIHSSPSSNSEVFQSETSKSEVPQLESVNTSVQTDDTFDTEAGPVIKELADTAIERAITTLQTQDQLSRLREKMVADETTMHMEVERLRATEDQIRRALEQKNQLIEAVMTKEREAEKSRFLAVETCREITEQSFKNLQELDRYRPKRKSVGSDTRHLNRQILQLDLVTTELEKDFFPWIFSNAETMFLHKLAATNLADVRLDDSRSHRERAKRRLRIQLRKVNF